MTDAYILPTTHRESRSEKIERIRRIAIYGLLHGIDQNEDPVTLINNDHSFFPFWGSDFSMDAYAIYCSTCGEKECNPHSQMCKACIQGRNQHRRWYFATDEETLYYTISMNAHMSTVETPVTFEKWIPATE